MVDMATIVLDAETRGLKSAKGDLNDLANSTERSATRIGKSMRNVGLGLTVGVTAPLGLFGKGAVQAASDAEEMNSAFDVVFGNMSQSVRAWAEETGNAMGRSTQEVQRGALAFQELFGKALQPEKAADLSKEFAVLTQDLASFKNLSNEVAQQKLFSGLTGEAEPLRAVGVFINDAAVKAKALELGLGGVSGALTDQEKIVARAALIQEQLADAQGDVLRTSDSAANQVKRSKAAFEELQVAVGEKLLPAFTPLVEGVGSLVNWFAQLPAPIQTVGVGLGAVAAVAGPLLIVFGSMATALPLVSAGFAALTPLLAPIAAGAAAIGAAGYVLYQNWDKISPVLSNVGEALQSALGEAAQELIGTLQTSLTELWEGPLGEGIRTVGAALRKFGETYGAVLGGAFTRILSAAAGAVGNAFGIVTKVLGGVAMLLTGDFSGAWNAAKDIVLGVGKTIADFIGTLLPEVVQLGKDIVRGIVRGIKSAPGVVYDALKSVVGYGVDSIKSFLGIASPSRLFMGYGLNVSQGFAIGIENGQPAVEGALGKLTGAAESAGVAVGQSVQQMVSTVSNSLSGLANKIKDGGFLGILEGLIGAFVQIGSTGLFGQGLAQSLTSAPSFAGGGFTGHGPRSGGLDGKGGFMAMLHPNETVVDHARGGGGNDNNAHITFGVDPHSGNIIPFINGEVQRAAPAIANAGATMAQDMMARSGRRRIR